MEQSYIRIMEVVARTVLAMTEDERTDYLSARSVKPHDATTNIFQPFFKLIVRDAAGGDPEEERRKAPWVTTVAQMCHGLIEGGHVPLQDGIPALGSFVQWLNKPDQAGRKGWEKGIAAYNALRSVQDEKLAKKEQEVKTANDTVASYIACNLDNPIAAIPLKECKVKLKASHLYLGTVIYSPDHEAVLVLDTVDLHDTRRLAKFLGDFGLAVTPPK